MSRKTIFALVGAFVAGLLLSGLLFYQLLNSRLALLEASQKQATMRPANRPLYIPQPPLEDDAYRAAKGLGDAFSAAAQRSMPGVVYIEAQAGRGVWHSLWGGNASSGSGVIFRADGYILTNHHVIDGASHLRVSLYDNSTYEAELVASDRYTDLAVIKINATGLQALSFADSDELGVGDWVLAVGNPFNLTNTVTHGIVSAKARNINLISSKLARAGAPNLALESFIQTDAAVNPGNSGGALIDLDGKLVGINTAIATDGEAFQGYSFAVPSNLAYKVANDLIEHGRVQRAFLGVTIQDINHSWAQRNGLPVSTGALVTGLSPNGSAGQAGMRVGDVIVAIDGRPIQNTADLQEKVGRYSPGQRVQVRLYRRSQELSLRVELRNANGTTQLLEPEDAPLSELRPQDRAWMNELMGGALVEPLPEELAAIELPGGIEVYSLEEDGPLFRAGVPEGYIFWQAQDEEIMNLSELHTLLRSGPRRLRLHGMDPDGTQASYVVTF